MTNKKRVLILCTGNSARSQMAKGLLREIGGNGFEGRAKLPAPRSNRSDEVNRNRYIKASLEIGC